MTQFPHSFCYTFNSQPIFSSIDENFHPIHYWPSEAGDCSHPPPKMAMAENLTSGKAAFDFIVGHGSLRFLHANRYWIRLTCYTVIFGHYTSEWSNGTLAFSGGKQVTSSKEAGDWGFAGVRLTLQSQFSRAGVERSCWQQCCGKFLVPQPIHPPPKMAMAENLTPPTVEVWVVHLSSGWFVNLLGQWNQLKLLISIFLNVIL